MYEISFRKKAIFFKRLGLLRIQPVISICGVWTMQAMDDARDRDLDNIVKVIREQQRHEE